MTNKYGGICQEFGCGVTVEAGAGGIKKLWHSKWRKPVWTLYCKEHYRPTKKEFMAEAHARTMQENQAAWYSMFAPKRGKCEDAPCCGCCD